jgi:LemA protein
MSGLFIGLIVIVLIVVAFIAWVIGLYNSLQRRKLNAENAWSDIDVQLKRRHDLIPNLVSTVKGYAEHEKSTFDAVTQARSAAVGANGIAEQAGAENMLTQALGKMFAVAEAYPDLKANTNFLNLQEELTSTENKIGFARQHFNRSVNQFNEATKTFPSNIIAGSFGFTEMDFFELDEAEAAQVKQAPKVEF